MTTKKVVRVATAGSVDDGKSTLLGRLLLDCEALLQDQLEHIQEASLRRGFARTELALLTDGLRAEREQGITIDVAWRYFATKKARFILADTPGHVEYTRNMVTGASTAEVIVMLVDAERGVTEQTRRHLWIAALLGIPRVVVAVNKMDRVAFERARFHGLAVEVGETYRLQGGTGEFAAVPVSALHGDNVVHRSSNMPWYEGPTLLGLLEAVGEVEGPEAPARMAVQWVIRPQEERYHTFRGLAGRVDQGTLRVGQNVKVLPAGHLTTIRSLEIGSTPLQVAIAGQSVVLQLQRDLDVARGDMVVAEEAPPILATELVADVCWLSARLLNPPLRVTLKHTTRRVRGVITEVIHRAELGTGHREPSGSLGFNDLGQVRLRLAEPIMAEVFSESRRLGAAILVDEASTETLAACMIRALG